MHANVSVAGELKSRKKKKSTPETQFRLNLEQCSKTKDLPTAITLFNSATSGDGEIHLNQQHFNSLLYICSNAVTSQDQSQRHTAVEFGFRVFEFMRSKNITPSEATVTAVARLAAAKDDGDAAFELAKSVGGLGRLRTYSSALFCYCRNGMDEKAVQVEEHIVSLGLRLEESELAALLKVHVEKGKGDKVYEYMHKLRAAVRQVSESTADVMQSWFSAELASKVGLENLDMDQVNEAKLRNGGGWHGLGWLGKGNWVVQKSNVTSDGVCRACGGQLICVDIERAETEHFAESIASLALEREVQSNFKEFQDWMDECAEYEAIVDGANVGLYQQNFADGGFSISQLDAVVRELYARNKKWPLVILHQKRVKGLLENASSRETVQNWIDQDVLYGTPYGSNDDWYWLYAAVKLECMLVTNDEMRDHIFELLGSSLFFRWKERHQVKYSFLKGKPTFVMPPPYSLVIQESGTGSWHVPLAGDVDDESLRTWLCVNRSRTSDALPDRSTSKEPSEDCQHNGLNERCCNSDILAGTNNADEICDFKTTSVTDVSQEELNLSGNNQSPGKTLEKKIGDLGQSMEKGQSKESNQEVMTTESTRKGESTVKKLTEKEDKINAWENFDARVAKICPQKVEVEAEYWASSVISHVLGAHPPYRVMNAFYRHLWGHLGVDKVLLLPTGLFLIIFKSMHAREEALKLNIYHFGNGHPVIVKPWTVDEGINYKTVSSVPVWVQFPNLELKYWNPDSLSSIASILGTPIMTDDLTDSKKRVHYARVLIDMEIKQEVPDEVLFEDEKGVVQHQKVHYEWKPVVCKSYDGYGHDIMSCRKHKQPATLAPQPATKKKGEDTEWRKVEEKIGGVPVALSDTEPLKYCIEECGLQDLKQQGTLHTWCNKQIGSARIYAKLDRKMVNGDWVEQYNHSITIVLTEGISDHCPLMVQLEMEKKEGGLGIYDARTWNEAAILKQVWWLANEKENLWLRWMHEVYLKGKSIWEVDNKVDSSWSWKQIVKLRDKAKERFNGGNWKLSKNGIYSISSGYKWLQREGEKFSAAPVIWSRLNIPKHSFIAWLVWKGRVWTKDRLSHLNIPVQDPLCCLCEQQEESLDHLFFCCKFSKDLLSKIKAWLGLRRLSVQISK
ncbi:OLC1v1004527C1 [Oldenlandia corymbosa var. corymbosa]|uniref:ribonuclease P n=1 Tax=Oldenlandia corymbosa var. corymbosa TaxID=529605 RepID=A0AAV1DEX5_OLDCO|nr:OLC1v1004527C1 [Oldenlandia corymbosa var. corymbosa]